MEKQTPLHFFNDLNIPNFFSQLKEDFYTTGIAKQADIIDRENEFITGQVWFEEDEAPTEFNITFSQHLQRLLIKNNNQALKEIDTDVYSLAKDSKEANLYIKYCYNLLNHYMERCSAVDSHLHGYRSIYNELFNIKQELQGRYQIQDSTIIIKQTANKTYSSSDIKLKWLGKGNLLTTLFYDLTHGKPDEGIPILLQASTKELEEFIYNNFSEANGESFSQQTLNTNLKASRQKDKRAKGDISIEIRKHT